MLLEQVERGSPLHRASEARSPGGRPEPGDTIPPGERQHGNTRGGGTLRDLPGPERAHRAEPESHRAEAERHRAESERHRAETEKHRAEAERNRVEAERHRAEPERAQRADSLPPRRPPPPAPPAHSAPHQRLARAHSHAAPARPPDPPLVSVNCRERLRSRSVFNAAGIAAWVTKIAHAM